MPEGRADHRYAAWAEKSLVGFPVLCATMNNACRVGSCRRRLTTKNEPSLWAGRTGPFP
ncbi:hypothetical protein AGR7B_Cc70195 [Agrobacterium deltaense RV3]|nr:hypothetical protein AGR7B_Cc70195 [Agrobacterium deltaense RV3]